MACLQCDDIFTKGLTDIRRGSPGTFCSRWCYGRSMAGREMAEVACSGCGVLFQKPASFVRNELRRGRKRHFCTTACYVANIDRGALAARVTREIRVLSQARVPQLTRFLRSQKAGIARGRNLSRAQLRAIGLAGVEAKRQKGTLRTRGKPRLSRRAIDLGRQWIGPVILREKVDG